MLRVNLILQCHRAVSQEGFLKARKANIEFYPQIHQSDHQCYLMWFKKNGHFAKNDKNESEVSHEFPKFQKALYGRV
jgi:hypothetical protein